MCMKTCFLSACICALSFQSMSQITIESTGSLPTEGVWYYVYNSDTSMSPGPAGEDQTWDFSSFITTDSGVNGYVASGNTPWDYEFPGTSTAIVEGGGIYTYIDPSTALTAIRGIYDSSTGRVTTFSDPKVVHRFPFTYDNSYVDAWENSGIMSEKMYNKTGVDSVVADGWGKLILPNGTFNQTLRIRTISNFVETVVTGSTSVVVGTTRSESYSWYMPGHPRIFLTSNSVFLPAGSSTPVTTGFSQYTGAEPIDLSVPNIDVRSLTVFPNPVKEQLRVAFSSATPVRMSVTLKDMTGRSVIDYPAATYPAGSNELKLNTGSLSGGIYLLCLNTGSEIISRKVEILN